MFVNNLCAVVLFVFLCVVQAVSGTGVEKASALNVNAARTLEGAVENGDRSESYCQCADGSFECRLQNGICMPDHAVGLRLLSSGKPCDCGPNSVSCTFVNAEKVCTCKYNYVQAPNGTCIKPCNCQNGGRCVNNLCECRYGTYGDSCEVIVGCEGEGLARACGDPLEVYCALNYARGSIRCECLKPGLTYDEKTRTCKECQCGPDGYCSFDRGEKKCDCSSDYVVAEKGAEREGQCRPCACGPNSDKCKYNSTGKICNCKKGFAQRVSQCKECECGLNATCSFEGYKKVCTCNKGYKMENNTCVGCDCGPHGSCLLDDKYQKVCTCNKDAILYKDYCVECNCGLDGSCQLNSEGKKTCTCDPGFGDREGYCIACQCYYGNETVPCTFTNKIQNCQCPEGYEEHDFYCQKSVDRCSNGTVCPSTTTCKNTWDSFECVCKDGFRPYSDGRNPKTNGCEEIDICKEPGVCPYNDSTECIKKPGGYSCICKKGYVKMENATLQESPCYPEPNSHTTAYIIGGTIGGLVVIAIPVGYFIYRRRSRNIY